MNDKLIHRNKPLNLERRKLLLGAAGISATSIAPSVFSKSLPSRPEPALSGKLICKIIDPVKTLVLRNHSDKTVVINKLSHGAFMFDGSIVDCNTACQRKPITILPDQEIEARFDIRDQFALSHRNPDEYQRIQSLVKRLSDGTRVIPFSAKLHANVATIVWS